MSKNWRLRWVFFIESLQDHISYQREQRRSEVSYCHTSFLTKLNVRSKDQKKFWKSDQLNSTFSECFVCSCLLKDKVEHLIYLVFVKVRRHFSFPGFSFFLPCFVMNKNAFKQTLNRAHFYKRSVWWYVHDWLNYLIAFSDEHSRT